MTARFRIVHPPDVRGVLPESFTNTTCAQSTGVYLEDKSSGESARILGGSDGTRFKQGTGGKTGVECWALSKSKRKSVLVHAKQLALVLAFALAFQNSALAFPASDAAQGSSQGSKVKTEIQKYDITKKRQVKVTLRSGNEIKGFVSRSDDVSFDLTEKNGHVSTLSYGEVDKVHGAGLSRGAKIGIVVASAVAVVAVVFAIGLKRAGF
jgi:hypothetical protein